MTGIPARGTHADAGRGAALLRRQLHGLGAARAARAVPARGPRAHRHRSRDWSPPSRCSAARCSGRCSACSATASAAAAPACIGMVLTLVAAGRRLAVRARRPRTSTCSGFFLGIAGASFAVALPLASRWYPPEYQGLAMGIAGAGNSGTLLATLFAPRLAEHFGWAATFGMAMLPHRWWCSCVFALIAQGQPDAALAPTSLRRLRRGAARARHAVAVVPLQPDVRRLRRLRQLPHDVLPRAVPACRAWRPATSRRVVVVAGSFLRPVGGWLSDRVGGYRLLVGAARRRSPSASASWPRCRRCAVAVALLFVGMGLLGMGNGAVFQLVPQRFPERIGLVTGVVGAAGGLGGFFLPSLLGAVQRLHRSATPPGCSAAPWPSSRHARAARARRALVAALGLAAVGGRACTRTAARCGGRDERVRDGIHELCTRRIDTTSSAQPRRSADRGLSS